MDELGVNPAEVWNLAARHYFVEISEACRKVAEVVTMEWMRHVTTSRYARQFRINRYAIRLRHLRSSLHCFTLCLRPMAALPLLDIRLQRTDRRTQSQAEAEAVHTVRRGNRVAGRRPAKRRKVDPTAATVYAERARIRT